MGLEGRRHSLRGRLYHTASFHLAALLDALLTGVEPPVVEIEIAREWS